MNVWKPLAIFAVAGLVASVGIQTASANHDPDPQPTLTGPCHDQPNMAAALGSLNAAKSSLERAEHNKGGWRLAALNATNNAISQTQTGCSAAP
ncbi:MAG TPA: hypothetical protein VGG39_23200 [Polyangiaceae bacterium]|jgi:hypothetical protein